jgi:hypothetical protein
MMFLDCPAYLEPGGAVRCALPAVVRYRFIVRSSNGLLESVIIRCPAGHQFNGPIEFLTCENRQKHDTASRALWSAGALPPVFCPPGRAAAGRVRTGSPGTCL